MASTEAGTARRAVASLVGSALSFAVMAVLAKGVAGRIPGPQVALVRFVFGVATCAIGWAGGAITLRPRRWGWLLMRGGFGGLAVLAYFACIEHAPVGVATLLNYTSPVFALLGSWILLDERPRPAALGALTLTMAGVCLVMWASAVELAGGLWETIGLLSAVGSGLAVTAIRAARRPLAGGLPPESTWSVFFSFTALGALVTLPFSLPPLGHWVAPSGREWALLVGVAASSMIAQYVMTAALQHVGAATAGIVHQLTVVAVMASGVLLFGDRLTPRALVGSALTVLGVVLTMFATTSEPPPPAKRTTQEGVGAA